MWAEAAASRRIATGGFMHAADDTPPRDGARPSGPVIVGRDRERRLLDEVLAAVSRQGAALLLSGEPGVGKTALLDYAARAAVAPGVGARVLRLRGVESEASLPFAVLADLLLPLREHLPDLPEAQRSALEICLALAGGEVASPYPACAGTLNVLAEASERQPLVVLVDDLPWVDPSSAQVLLFVARRLASERVAIVLTARPDPPDRYDRPGLPAIDIRGLTRPACAQLLTAHRLGVTDHVLASLVDWTGGNPLALLEVAALLSPAQRSGETPLGDLPPSHQLEFAWSKRLDRLPARAQDALTIVAASRSGDLGVVAAALAAAGLDIADLDPAQHSGLLLTDTEAGVDAMPLAVRFRHPLLRPVVLRRAPLSARLRAYRALTETSSGELKAWYGAAAVTGPDERVAESLAAVAADAARRGGYAPAALAWRRAAELTARPGRRAERLLLAARHAYLAGLGPAMAWSQEAARIAAAEPDAGLRADIDLLRGRILAWSGRVEQARQLLTAAAETLADTEPARAAALLAEAVFPAATDGRFDLALLDAQRAYSLATAGQPRRGTSPAGEGPPLPVVVALVETLAFAGRVREAEDLLSTVRPRLSPADPGNDLETLAWAAQCLPWLEQDTAAAGLLGRLVDQARLRGTPALLRQTLSVRAELDIRAGRWADADADADEALQWARELGHANSIAYSLVSLARIAAARGDRARFEEHIDDLRRTAGPLRIRGVTILEAAVLGFEHLSHGEYGPAVTQLERAWGPALRGGLDNPVVVPFAADLAEAHLRGGERSSAEKVLDWLEERAEATGLAWPAATAARCRGLAADRLADAEAAFALARDAHQRHDYPFERARTQLCEGEVMRRLRRPGPAREPLRAAHATFEALGARPWASRAAAELAAAGSPITAAAPPQPLGLLTSQELRIARAISQGLSNAEVAAALFMSRKTVEAHLTHIYRKLSLRSRTDLTRLMITQPSPP
ncbi:helix-turn-helix transcriptional regulator [Pseudofrankia sp. BMG5.36]|uniref:AAA family ATPase n=1 Tax=Pseudofrankia sp. BMG5.36 TaxID=1834512 RepID=UPI000A75EC19|nr:helix-turn-helix transcriptional regulator [Pseudofrankia sp. BMG5.36]